MDFFSFRGVKKKELYSTNKLVPVIYLSHKIDEVEIVKYQAKIMKTKIKYKINKL